MARFAFQHSEEKTLNISRSVRFRSLRRLSRRDAALLLLALPVVAAVRLTLWLIPSRWIVRGLARFDAARSPEGVALASVSSIVWAIEVASRRIPRASCLTQAIAAKLLLRTFGYDAKLCLGVTAVDASALRAHAWLERNGQPILGGSDSPALARLPQLPVIPVTRAPFLR